MPEDQPERFLIHDYWTYPNRYEIVDSFWQGHKGLSVGKFPENICPPLAAFILREGEPIAFVACYQAVGIGVGILDLICTKPGMSLAESKGALLFGVKGILKALQANNYGLCIAYPTEPVGRVLSRSGWQDHGLKAQLMTSTEQ